MDVRGVSSGLRVGVIHNPRSHRNCGLATPPSSKGVRVAAPATPDALTAEIARFAADRIDLLVVDGGDGTLRDVLGHAVGAFAALPPVAVVPHGKTNALAGDLGLPRGWSIGAAITAASKGRRAIRPTIAVCDGDAAQRYGFVFGVGAFVDATRMADRAHRAGMIDNLAVGATLAGAVAKAVIGRGRQGSARMLTVAIDDDGGRTGSRFLTFASTLQRLPLGMRPFGAKGPGLKVLDVDAPPRRLLSALPPVLAGREPAWLEDAGYRRRLAREVKIQGAKAFVLDGEIYPVSGGVTLRTGPEVVFVTP